MTYLLHNFLPQNSSTLNCGHSQAEILLKTSGFFFQGLLCTILHSLLWKDDLFSPVMNSAILRWAASSDSDLETVASMER